MQNVYLHDLNQASSVRKIAIRGSVLDVAWGTSDLQVFAGGLGKEVRSYVPFRSSLSNPWLRADLCALLPASTSTRPRRP